MKKHLTFRNSLNIMILWNSKSEVMKCLHAQGGQKRKTQSHTTSKSGLMMKRQKGSMNIAKSTELHGPRQSGRGFICFWHKKNKETPGLESLATFPECFLSQTLAGVVQIFYYTPRKRSTVTFNWGDSYTCEQRYNWTPLWAAHSDSL